MYRLLSFGTFLTLIVCANCVEKKNIHLETHFTKEDSVTDSYLALQDSMLQAWNIMINDDNRKIKSLHNLIYKLYADQHLTVDQKNSLEQQLEQLMRIRYTPKTMANPDVVEEYDFASSSLISEVIAIATSSPHFISDKTLQSLTESVTDADQRILLYRGDYDLIASNYNAFIQKYKDILKYVDQDSSLEQRPLFNMLADEQ